MIKPLEKLVSRINELASELDGYHISEADIEDLPDYEELMDSLDYAFSELQDSGQRLIERLEGLQDDLDNIDGEDYEAGDYEDN
jgi:hypothetical protein